MLRLPFEILLGKEKLWQDKRIFAETFTPHIFLAFKDFIIQQELDGAFVCGIVLSQRLAVRPIDILAKELVGSFFGVFRAEDTGNFFCVAHVILHKAGVPVLSASFSSCTQTAV